jgi:hypothetical protein
MLNKYGALFIVGFAVILFVVIMSYAVYMSAEMPRPQYESVFSDLERYPQMQSIYDRMMANGEMSSFEFEHWQRQSIIEYRKWYIKNQFGGHK